VLDLDIRAFFDSVPHDLLLKAVAHHTDERWVLLYVSRWLVAPVQMPDGTIVAREKGNPTRVTDLARIGKPALCIMRSTGGWTGSSPVRPFERYADDVLAHCDSEEQAHAASGCRRRTARDPGSRTAPRQDQDRVLQGREPPRGLRAHQLRFPRLHLPGPPRSGSEGLLRELLARHEHQGGRKAKGQQIRAWHLNRRTGTDLSGLAEDINPQVRGWINYYGAFYRSELYPLVRRIDEHLVRWAMQKFKRFRGKPWRAWDWLAKIRQLAPKMFAHWQLARTTTNRLVGAV
jgi:RNA-directed DNA polymerase